MSNPIPLGAIRVGTEAYLSKIKSFHTWYGNQEPPGPVPVPTGNPFIPVYWAPPQQSTADWKLELSQKAQKRWEAIHREFPHIPPLPYTAYTPHKEPLHTFLVPDAVLGDAAPYLKYLETAISTLGFSGPGFFNSYAKGAYRVGKVLRFISKKSGISRNLKTYFEKKSGYTKLKQKIPKKRLIALKKDIVKVRDYIDKHGGINKFFESHKATGTLPTPGRDALMWKMYHHTGGRWSYTSEPLKKLASGDIKSAWEDLVSQYSDSINGLPDTLQHQSGRTNAPGQQPVGDEQSVPLLPSTSPSKPSSGPGQLWLPESYLFTDRDRRAPPGRFNR